MFVEDLIIQTADVINVKTHDGKFVASLARRALENRPLTTRQGYAFLSFMRKNRYLWTNIPKVESILSFPEWKLPLEESKVIHHEVRYIGDNYLGFRTNRSRATGPAFERLDAVWSQGMHVIQVNSRERLEQVISLIGEFGFAMDQAVETYLVAALEAKGLPSSCTSTEEMIVIDVPDDDILAAFSLHVLRGETF